MPRGKKPEVRLNMAEHEKLEVIEAVRRGQLTQVRAAGILEMTDRWVRQLVRRLVEEGPGGLLHRSRGRGSNRRVNEGMRERVVRFYREKYEDFNLSHFQEMLQRKEGISPPCRETVRQILLDSGDWKRRRNAPRHRMRRPRREREGEMLQLDASIHPWLGEEEGLVALLGGIDDATGDVAGVEFCEAETTQGYMRLLKDILGNRGIPQEVYTDRDSVFVVNNLRIVREARERGEVAETQFGRVLRELGIRWIPAGSPQAKGRIERLWGTFQDRLLKELRLQGIRTLEEANRYVKDEFLPEYNRRFRREAAKPQRMYRPRPRWRDMEGILCGKETRTVARDHTISVDSDPWQIIKTNGVTGLAGKKVEIRKTLRGELEAWYRGKRLKMRRAPDPPPLAKADRSSLPVRLPGITRTSHVGRARLRL